MVAELRSGTSATRRSIDGPDSPELKDAMSKLGKAVLKVFRLTSPGLTYLGAFRELPSQPNPERALQFISFGDTLRLKAGNFEVDLYPVMTEADEAQLIDALMAKAAFRQHQRNRDRAALDGPESAL